MPGPVSGRAETGLKARIRSGRSCPNIHVLVLHRSEDATWILSLRPSKKPSPARIAAVRPLLRKHSFPAARQVRKRASRARQFGARCPAIANTQVVEREMCAGLGQ